MTDQKIIELYFARDERAIAETQAKYNDYCFTVANNILSNRQDSEECVNDTYLAAWRSIPPERPGKLSAYLAKITRNFALTRYRDTHAQKRNVKVIGLRDELVSLIPDGHDLASEYDARRIGFVIDEFLRDISPRDRKIFVLRYFYGMEIPQISGKTGASETNVRTILTRVRAKLAKRLEKEGVIV